MSLRSVKSSLFACPSCTRDVYTVFTSSYSAFRSGHLSLLLPIQHQQRTNHSTFASLRQGHHRKLLAKAIKAVAKGKKLPWSPKRHRDGPKRWEILSEQAHATNKKHLDTPLRPGEEEIDRELLVLKNTTDPLHIANIVRRGLRDGKREEVLAVSRVALSSGIINVVSWNHVIDFDMEQGEPKRAWAVYKEMKERGCRPDSHTYTIVLRGLARNVDKSSKSFDVIEKAMTVYEHLVAKGSKVRLLNIHKNSLLHVCARARDMDALWKAAGRFEEEGEGAADAKTYTTIIKTLSESTEKSDKARGVDRKPEAAEPEDDPRQDFKVSEDTVRDGEGIWVDIMSRWYKGDLEIDESMVTMMGRLYLRSPEKSDWEKVFKLAEETMGISLANEHKPKSSEADNVDSQPLGSRSRTPTSSSSPNMVVPGQKTLSLLISASSQLRLKKAAEGYWTLLTKDKSVEPDLGNFMDYFRVLRHNRSSTEVATLLQKMKDDPRLRQQKGFWSPGIFSLAISTCKRDIWNRSSFHNATQIMDVMSEFLSPSPTSLQPTPSILKSYLELGIGPQSGSNDVDKPGQEPSRQRRPNLSTSANNLTQALTRILRYIDQVPSEARVSIARDAVGACDRIITHQEASELDAMVLQELKELKSVVSGIETKAAQTAREDTPVVETSGKSNKAEKTRGSAARSSWTRGFPEDIINRKGNAASVLEKARPAFRV